MRRYRQLSEILFLILSSSNLVHVRIHFVCGVTRAGLCWGIPSRCHCCSCHHYCNDSRRQIRRTAVADAHPPHSCMEVADEIRGDRQELHVARGPALHEVELVALPPHIPIGGALAQLQHHPHRDCSPRRSQWSCLPLRTFLLQGGKWPPAAAAFDVSQLHHRIGIEGLGRKAQHGGAAL